MRTTKYLLFASLGVAALLLLTSDSAKQMRDDLEDTARENAKKWKQKLSSMGSDTSDKLADLKDMLSNEIEGLSDDVRERMETILNGTAKTATKMKNNVSKQMS